MVIMYTFKSKFYNIIVECMHIYLMCQGVKLHASPIKTYRFWVCLNGESVSQRVSESGESASQLVGPINMNNHHEAFTFHIYL